MMHHKRFMMHDNKIAVRIAISWQTVASATRPVSGEPLLSLGPKRGKQDTFHQIAVAIVLPALPLTTS
jgi:hypothetical protein